MTEKKFIRLDESKVIQICKHICLHAEEYEDDSGCEYVEHLNIKCEVCKKNFEFNVLVN